MQLQVRYIISSNPTAVTDSYHLIHTNHLYCQHTLRRPTKDLKASYFSYFTLSSPYFHKQFSTLFFSLAGKEDG